MATNNWDSADLKGLAHNGFVREDVMQQIMAIQEYPNTVSTMISSDGVKSSYSEWTTHTYEKGNLDNAHIDGADAAQNDTKGGARVGNHCQISRKVVSVSTRARNSDVVGSSDEFTEQLMRRTYELRRDVEAITLANQGSVADNGSDTAGKIGGLPAWLTTNTDRGVGGADGGFANGAITAATVGTKRALSDSAIRGTVQSIYEQGFDASVLMTSPSVRTKISEYLMSDAARVGIQQTDTGKSGPSTAVGSIHVYITDFGTLDIVANRDQPTANAATDDDSHNVFILTPSYLRHGFLHNYRTEALAKNGLADTSQVSVDWTLKPLAEQAQGIIADVDSTLAMTD